MGEFNIVLNTYRKLVSLIYREIGAMVRENHPELYDGSKLTTSRFAKARKLRTRQIYCDSRSERDPDAIVERYRRETGLSLNQVHEVFREGDWLLGRSKHSFGGPKWEKIAEVALELRQAIRDDDEACAVGILEIIEDLKHNNGRVVDKFIELMC